MSWEHVQLLLVYFVVSGLYMPLNWVQNRYVCSSRSLELHWDKRLPYLKSFYAPYFLGLSLIALGPIFFGYVLSLQLFALFIAGLLAIVMTGLLIWMIYPCKIEKPDRVAQASHFWLINQLLQYGEKNGNYNSFPSSHVSVVTYLLMWASLVFPEFLVLFVVVAVINAMSILLTKQHYIVDAVSGWLLAVIVFVLIAVLAG